MFILIVVVGGDLAGVWFCLDLFCDFAWCFIMLWLKVCFGCLLLLFDCLVVFCLP